MQPVRKVLSATHFKEVRRFPSPDPPTALPTDAFPLKKVRVPAKDDPDALVTKLTPCSPGDAAAKEMSWTDVDGDQLQEPILGMKDFLRAIANVRLPSASLVVDGRGC